MEWKRESRPVRLAWCLLLTFGAVAAEVLGAQAGVLLPAALFLSYYLGVAYGWRRGVFWGVLAVVCVEIVLGRRGTVLGLLLLLQPVSYFAARAADRASLVWPVVLGAAFGSLQSIVLLLGEHGAAAGAGRWAGLAHAGLLVTLSTLAAAVALPLLVVACDWVAAQLDLARCRYRAVRAPYDRD